MPFEPKRINFLLDKFFVSDINESEFNELCELLKDDENESDARQSLINDIKAAPFTNVDQVKLDAMLNKILRKEEVPVRRLFLPNLVRDRLWKRVVAAAAIIIVLGVSSYFAFFRPTEKPAIAKTPVPT